MSLVIHTYRMRNTPMLPLTMGGAAESSKSVQSGGLLLLQENSFIEEMRTIYPTLARIISRLAAINLLRRIPCLELRKDDLLAPSHQEEQVLLTSALHTLSPTHL